MRADPGRVRALLAAAIVAANDGYPADFTRWKEQARVALKLATQDEGDAVARFDAVRYTPTIWTDSTPQSYFDQRRAAGVREGVAILEAAVTELDVTVNDAPGVDPSGLHPWVSGSASDLWHGGHHRQAVEEAARAIEVRLKAKLGLADGTGAPLVTDAFSRSDPKPGQPRLRFTEFTAGSQDWSNAHEGAMFFGRGLMMRVRNLYVHGHEPTEDEALEALAALSLLARWVEAAAVETGD